MNFTLARDFDNGRCTLGILRLPNASFETMERPWVPGPPGGTKGVSCVPAGTYRLQKHDTEAHPKSFALVNEELGVYHYELPPGKEGRTACLIHVANRPEELRGCIALGMDRSLNGDQWVLASSRAAINRFYATVPWANNQHTLTISGAT